MAKHEIEEELTARRPLTLEQLQNEIAMVRKQCELTAYRADAVPPNYQEKPSVEDWRERVNWLLSVLSKCEEAFTLGQQQGESAVETINELRMKARGGMAYDGDPDTAADIIEEYCLPREQWEDPKRESECGQSYKGIIATLEKRLAACQPYLSHKSSCKIQMRLDDGSLMVVPKAAGLAEYVCDCGLTDLIAPGDPEG